MFLAKWNETESHDIIVCFNCSSYRPQGSLSDFFFWFLMTLHWAVLFNTVNHCGNGGDMQRMVLVVYNFGVECWERIFSNVCTHTSGFRSLENVHTMNVESSTRWARSTQTKVRQGKQCRVYLLNKAHCFHATEKASAEVWISKINKEVGL